MGNHVSKPVQEQPTGRSSTAAHTPGPWEQSKIGGLTIYAGKPHTQTRKKVCVATFVHDARLIAAAPEMLEALRDVVAFTNPGANIISGSVLDRVRAALAKAEGRS